MIVCPNCKKEHQDNSLYCGYCGTSLFSTDFMLDGNKNKRQISFANKLYYSTSHNVLYIVVYFVLFFIVTSLFVICLNGLINEFPDLKYHINQILIKYSYIKEGVSLSYISGSVVFIVNILSLFVLCLISLLNIPVALLHIFFGIYFLYHKRKRIKGQKIGKPVIITRINAFVTRFARVLNIIAVLLLLVLIIIKHSWM